MTSEETRNGGEPQDTERKRLARELEASGHSGCACDLEGADQFDTPTVAYEIAEHIEEACGDPDFSGDPELAAKIRGWADRLERADPAVARKVTMPVTIHQDGHRLHVDVNSHDVLDLAVAGVDRVYLTVNGEIVMEFARLDTPPGRNGHG